MIGCNLYHIYYLPIFRPENSCPHFVNNHKSAMKSYCYRCQERSHKAKFKNFYSCLSSSEKVCCFLQQITGIKTRLIESTFMFLIARTTLSNH